mmetsp:Transcript_28779/g.92867  ORF Transcript_28779/g.92867 Transcript_28779/m.92867 type:complete len:313 (+) Transcript_28779:117-1055(+)
MDTDGGVKVGLGHPRLERYSYQLDDFPSSISAHVDGEDLVGLRMDDELHESLFVSLRESMLHAPEACPVDVHVSVSLPALFLRWAHRSERRVGEDGGWDVRVVSLPRLASEERVRKAVTLREGDGGQLNSVDNISNSIDVVDRSLQRFVDDDRTALVKVDASLFASQPNSLRLPACCEHNDVVLVRRAIREGGHDAGPSLLQLVDVHVEQNFDTLLVVLRLEVRPEIIVETSQPELAPVQQRDVTSITMKYSCELNSDVSSPDNADTLRKLRKVEGLVRGDGELASGDLWDEGPASDRYRDNLGGVKLLSFC